jgi:hypothetical protein
MTETFHETVQCEVKFQVPKYKMQLVVIPSECRIALKRRLQDEDIAQELTLDLTVMLTCLKMTFLPNSDSDRKRTGCRHWTDTTES